MSDERREWVANIIDEYFIVMSREDLDYLMEFADERRECVLKYADRILALLDEEEPEPVAWCVEEEVPDEGWVPRQSFLGQVEADREANRLVSTVGIPARHVRVTPLYRSPEPHGVAGADHTGSAHYEEDL